jgi:capsular exopolysaccharide synthesis family protein
MGGVDAANSSALASAQFALQRVDSYAQVVTNPSVLNPVIRDLQLKVTARDLAKRVTATNPLNTVLLNVAVQDANRNNSAAIAQQVCIRFGQAIQTLETASGAKVSSSPVKATVVQPAAIPDGPVSPRTKLNLALGLLLGAAIGVGLIVLRDSLDTRINSQADLEALINGNAPLGLTPFDVGRVKKPLTVLEKHSSAAEAFKAVRTNLQIVDVDHPRRVIVVTSGLANEGNSTTAANLAITLGQAGSKTALVEGDPRRPRIANYLGIDPAVGMAEVLAGTFTLDQVLVPWGNGLLTVLPSRPTPPNPSELLGSQQMHLLLQDLREQFDFVICDSPPLLLVTDAAVFAAQPDGALIVVRHGKSRREQFLRRPDHHGSSWREDAWDTY